MALADHKCIEKKIEHGKTMEKEEEEKEFDEEDEDNDGNDDDGGGGGGGGSSGSDNVIDDMPMKVTRMVIQTCCGILLNFSRGNRGQVWGYYKSILDES